MAVASQMLTLASAQVLLKSRVRSSAWVGATCGCRDRSGAIATPRLVALGVGALGPVHALTALLSHATSLLLLCASHVVDSPKLIQIETKTCYNS